MTARPPDRPPSPLSGRAAVPPSATPPAAIPSAARAGGLPEPRRLIIDLPPGWPILTANNRMDRWSRSARVRELRSAAATLARAQGVPPLGPADITVTYASPPRLRRLRHPLASDAVTDSDAIAPTAKALVDGLVQAGLWPSDARKRIRSVTCELAPKGHPRGLVRVVITEIAEVA